VRPVTSVPHLGRRIRPLLMLSVALGALFVGATSVRASSSFDAPKHLPKPDVVLTVTTVDDIVSNADRQLSLREAFSAAALYRGTVAIDLIPGDVHRLICGEDEDENASGDLDFVGRNTLILRGGGATISPAAGPCPMDRLIDAPGGGTLVLYDLVLVGGRASSDGGAVRGQVVSLIESRIHRSAALGGRGGAIFATGDVAIVTSVLTQNSALTNGATAEGTGGAVHTLEDIWISDSTLVDNLAAYDGGAIYVGNGREATVLGSRLAQNRTDFGRGGAIFGGGDASVRLLGDLFEANVAAASSAGGGAVFVDGSLDVSNTSFLANESRSIELSAFLARGGGGGAIYSEGRLTVDDSLFEANTAGLVGAGGAINHKGGLAITRSVVTGNSAGGAGGGLYLVGNRELGEVITLTSVRIDSNRSNGTGGGGIFTSSAGEIRVEASRITANSALQTGARGGGMLTRGETNLVGSSFDNNVVGPNGAGGGVHAEQGSSVAILNTTIADNVAGSGGGLDVDRGPGAIVRIEHSTLAGNSAQSGANLSVRSLLVIGSSIVGDESGSAGCQLLIPALSLGANIDGDGSCGLNGTDDVALDGGVEVTLGLEVEGGQSVRRPIVESAFDNVPDTVCAIHPVDQVGTSRFERCDSGSVELHAFGVGDDLLSLPEADLVTVDLLANDQLGDRPYTMRFIEIDLPRGVLVSGTGARLSVRTLLGARSGLIGRYEICVEAPERCETATVSVRIEPRSSVAGGAATATSTASTTAVVVLAPTATTAPTAMTAPVVELGAGSIVVAAANGSIVVLGTDFSKQIWAPSSQVVAIGPNNGLTSVWLVLKNGSVVLADPSAELSSALNDASFGVAQTTSDPTDPIRAIVASPSGEGYLVARESGTVDAGGDAIFRGDLRSLSLRGQIVDIVSTPSGQGYWLIGADGGVFAFGDAEFVGSLGGLVLDQPIVGADTTNSGAGLWLFAADGGVFAFGDAKFYGSATGKTDRGTVIGGSRSPGGGGYMMARADGGLHLFGDAVSEVAPLVVEMSDRLVDVVRLAG